MSPFVHPNTRAKIKILGSDYQKTLEELIGKKNMPPEYGGLPTNPTMMDSPQEKAMREHVDQILAATASSSK